MSEVHKGPDTLAAGQLADLLNRKAEAHVGGHVADSHQSGPGAQTLLHRLHDVAGVVNERHLYHLHPEAVAQMQAGQQQGSLLVCRDQNAIPRLPLDAPEHGLKALAHAPHERQLVRLDTEKSGEAFHGVAPSRVLFIGIDDVHRTPLQQLTHQARVLLSHRPGSDADTAVLKPDVVFEGWKQRAHPLHVDPPPFDHGTIPHSRLRLSVQPSHESAKMCFTASRSRLRPPTG